jgi:uncharacterized membrane protein
MNQINAPEAVICVIASQIANVGESIIGAAFQEKEGFQWVSKQKKRRKLNLSYGTQSFFFLVGGWGVILYRTTS